MADRMDGATLRTLIDHKIAQSVGSGSTTDLITADRIKAEKYYRGDPFGDEKPGKSRVVSRDVAEAIDGMMPSLMKIFSSGDEVVTFNATKPEEEDAAAQATDYVNWIWSQQNEGYQNFHSWFKDGLWKKLGTIKIWWDPAIRYTRETYEGLTDDELQQLLADDNLELKEQDSYPDSDVPPPPPQMVQVLQQVGIPVPPPPMLHDVVLRRKHEESQVRVAPVPPDETLIDRQSGADELPWGNRRRVTVADLIAEFPNEKAAIMDLPYDGGHDYDIERVERYADEGMMTRDQQGEMDPLTRLVWVVDAYFKVDYDGDGYAEMRKITTAGVTPGAMGAILENVEYDDNPFCCVTPIPMPHKLIGMSIADQVVDIQLIKSTLSRQALDNVYLSNGSEVVVTGEVDTDALLNRRPGNVIRAKTGATVVPLPVPQMLGDIMESISYFDTVKDQRTGAPRVAPGPGADSLNNAYTQTAAGANMVQSEGQERVAYIARTFAETGVKRAFRRIFELTCKHQNKAQVIKLRGQWVPINPAEWNDKMNLTVTVGLGTNNKTVQVSQLMTLLTQVYAPIVAQQQGLNGPLVTGQNIHHALSKLVEAMGFKGPDQFFQDPTQQPQQPPQKGPDPIVQQAQIKAQADLSKTTLTTQSAEKLAMAKIQSEENIAQLNAAVERELGYAKIATDNKAIDTEAALKSRQHETDTLFKAHEAGRAAIDSDRTHGLNVEKQASDAQHDALALTKTPNSEISAAPPKPPKMAGITVNHTAGGALAGIKRQFDDGTEEHIPIAHQIDGAPGQM